VCVIKLKSYYTYLDYIRLLKNFKEVEFKTSYTINVNYTKGNSIIYTNKRECFNCFYYLDKSHLLQIKYTDVLYDSLYLNILEHEYKDTFNDGDFKWHRSDYKFEMLPDFIYFYYYRKLVRKIKTANTIKVKDVREYNERVNQFIQIKSREDNLELLLN